MVPLSEFVKACRGGWEEAGGCVAGPLMPVGVLRLGKDGNNPETEAPVFSQATNE